LGFLFTFSSRRDMSRPLMEGIKRKAVDAEKLIFRLQSQVTLLKKNGGVVNHAGEEEQRLQQENSLLRNEIEKWIKKLNDAEAVNGKKQVSSKGLTAVAGNHVVQSNNVEIQSDTTPTPEAPPSSKPAKQQKVKEKPAQKSPGKADAAPEDEEDFPKLDLRVGKIVDVKRHPDADSLYLEQIDVGEEKQRTVISGLVKFVPLEEMQQRMVVVLCNLKPVKMRGISSEAMVMCASTPEKVEPLLPPVDCVPGDLIWIEKLGRTPDAVLNPKKKTFEKVAPFLRTNEQGVASYKGDILTVQGKGGVLKAPTLCDVPIK